MHIQVLKREGKPVVVEPEYMPARIIEIELGQPLPFLSAFDQRTNHYYKRALCLVRLHTQPLGMLELELAKNGVSPLEYAQFIWQKFQAKINEHLQQDGLPPVTELDEAGIINSGTPACIEAREQFLVDPPFVSIVIPTHDRPKTLATCLSALLALHYPNYEIIVVDNVPSTSETAELVQQISQKDPRVHYVCEHHPGSSWARNRGMLEARGEILAFADDDVVVDPYWLVEFARAFSLAAHVACVTGPVMPLELETPAQLWFEEYGGFNKGFTQRLFDLEEHHPKTPFYPYAPRTFGDGASMAFTKSFLQSIGGFDPALGVSSRTRGGEDFAVFFQVIKRGYALVQMPGALAYHLHRRTYQELRKQIYSYGIGFTGYLVKCVYDQPQLLLELIPKIPYGLIFFLRSHSPKNSKQVKILTSLNRLGMLYGLFAYLLSRRATQDTRKELAAIIRLHHG